MAATLANTKIAVDFLQFDVSLFKATGEDKVDLDSLDDQGHKCRMVVVCDVPHPDQQPCTIIDCLDSHVAAPGGRIHRATWGSFFGLPKRGYPKDPSGQYLLVLTNEELKAAKVTQAFNDLTVEKVVDLAPFLTHHGTGTPVYVLPARDADDKTLRLYWTFVEVLADAGRGMLSRLTRRGSTTRYVLVADKARGIMAYPVADLRDQPYEVRHVSVNDKDKAKAAVFLDEAYNQDPAMAPAEDGVAKLLEERLRALQAQQLEQSVQPAAPKPA